MSHRKRLIPLLLCSLVPACSPAGESPAPADAAATQLHCGDFRFSVEFIRTGGTKVIEPAPGDTLRIPDDSVVVTLPETVLRLPQALSADGVRFASEDETLVFWTRGDRARLQLPDTTFDDCVER
jgi:membrane-bound inhibitor of C-type lysozyme